MLVRSDEDVKELQPWHIRTVDGRVRGPVGLSGLKSLLEVGILTRAAMITDVEDDHWISIQEHPIWPRLLPLSKPLRLRNAELPEAEDHKNSLLPTSPVSEERMLKMEAVRRREIQRTHHRLAWWQFGGSLRIIRELFVFLGFLTAGDLAVSFFDTSGGVAKWVVLLCLSVTAVIFYCFRAIVG